VSTPTTPAGVELDDIQGAVVPGFLKPHQTLLGLRVRTGTEAAKKFKLLVRTLSDQVATGRETLADRRDFRDERGAAPTGFHRAPVAGTVFIGLAFTYRGLRRLTSGADAIESDAFRLGMPVRSSLLGDPTNPKSAGHPSNWIVGGSGRELDALVVVAGDHRTDVDAKVATLKSTFARFGVTVAYAENGDVLDGAMRGHEHFGFDDGVSQPGIRGRASSTASDFITDRHIDARDVPATWLFGYPGQDLVWPGELVLGHPATSPDPLLPGPPRTLAPEWTRNGSFLVFRRLRQDVAMFWNAMRELSHKLAKQPGFTGITDAQLAARLVGRWQSGAPLNRTPLVDDPPLGKNRFANNWFRFDSDTPRVGLAGIGLDTSPLAKADPVGIACPWAAHIRKLNTRDSASDVGSRDSTYNRRLLRVGVPYGLPARDPFVRDRRDRGLLFLSIQSSIESQFEFLVARWANDDARPKMPGGNDMLIGQNAAAPNGVRRCTIFGADLHQAPVSTDAQWVMPTGGGYFFVPSLSAIRNVLAK